MTSSYTTNKGIEQPPNGAYNNDWNVPINNDWAIIDTCFGGTLQYGVNGLTGTHTLTLTQYQPPNIEIIGTLGANLIIAVPAGVGGMWSVYNGTTTGTGGPYTLSFQVLNQTLTPTTINAGLRALFVSDGNDMDYADKQYAYVQAQAAITSAVSAAESFSSDASNLASGTVPAARLPFAGLLPGITIAANPGTVPTGAAGSIWYYY